jgi:hypothetical protein
MRNASTTYQYRDVLTASLYVDDAESGSCHATNRLNQQPTKNNTDFPRVSENTWLAGQSKYWRQLIVRSKFTDPSILSTFKRNAASVGILKVGRRVP